MKRAKCRILQWNVYLIGAVLLSTWVWIYFVMTSDQGLQQKSHELQTQLSGEETTHQGILEHHIQETRDIPYNFSKHHVTDMNKFSGKCKMTFTNETQQSQTPYKIYVYDLPPKFNSDLTKCIQVHYGNTKCFHTDYCGYGPKLFSDLDLTVHHSWQFALEVIVHHRLLASPYRTQTPEEANAYYVPYYAGLDCFCHMDDDQALIHNIQELADYIQGQQWYKDNKPHVTTLGKIEREHFSTSCALLLQPKLRTFHLIGIEEEMRTQLRFYMRKTHLPLILAPYPSYGHLNTGHGQKYLQSLTKQNRTIFLLLAAGTRRSNPFRAKILNQFTNRTSSTYKEYFGQHGYNDNTHIDSVWLETPECIGHHELSTLDWMKHAQFCLQPPGDSPTRKSFFDAIVSGCVPVIFQTKALPKYPFQARLNYTSFTVVIDSQLVEQQSVISILHQRRPNFTKLQQNLINAVQHLQYSYPITSQLSDDAFQFILDELEERIK